MKVVSSLLATRVHVAGGEGGGDKTEGNKKSGGCFPLYDAKDRSV